MSSFRQLTRFSRPFSTSLRQFNEPKKTVTEQVGDAVKGVAQAFKSDGAIGSKFQPDGSVGSTAQELGGPFDKDGAVGKQFKDSGAIGGTGEKVATDLKQKGEQIKSKQ